MIAVINKNINIHQRVGDAPARFTCPTRLSLQPSSPRHRVEKMQEIQRYREDLFVKDPDKT